MSHRRPTTITLVALLAVGLLAVLYRAQSPDKAAGNALAVLPPIGNSPSSGAASPPGVQTEADRPAPAPHDKMHFLQFRYAGGSLALSTARQVTGTVKHQRSLMDGAGIYYRSLSSQGKPLADGTVPDPRLVPYAFDHIAGGAEAGAIMLEETEFVVRVPAHPDSATIELFTFNQHEASRSQFALPQNTLGSFPLSK